MTTATIEPCRPAACPAIRVAVLVAIVAALLAPATASATAETAVDAGELRAQVEASPWGLTITDSAGKLVLGEHPGTGAEPTGTLGFRSGGVWRHATRVEFARREGDAWIAQLATTDPVRRLAVRIEPDGRGVVALSASRHAVGTRRRGGRDRLPRA